MKYHRNACVFMQLLHLAVCQKSIPMRAMITFYTREQAALPHYVPNTTVYKQAGRRLILDFGRAWDEENDTKTIYENIDRNIIELIEPESFVSTSVFKTHSYIDHNVEKQKKKINLRTLNYNQWSLKDTSTYSVKPEKAWLKTKGDSAIRVAVLDTGWKTGASGMFKNALAGYDFKNSDNDPTHSDVCGSVWHGSMTSSIIAAKHELNWNGIAPDVSIQMLKVLDDCGGGGSFDVWDALDYAQGAYVYPAGYNPTPANIISMSLNGDGACPSGVQSAINSANNKGIIVVVSAGNANKDTSGVWPSNCANVIVVGASTQSGNRASYSNFGNAVTVSAPGGEGSYLILGGYGTGLYDYTLASGTSFACPHVSGILALWMSWLNILRVKKDKLKTSISNNVRSFASGYCTSGCGTGIIQTFISFDQSTYLSKTGTVNVYDNYSNVVGQMGTYEWLDGTFQLSDCCWRCVSFCATLNTGLSYFNCTFGISGQPLCSSVCRAVMCASENYYTNCYMDEYKTLTATCSQCSSCSAGSYRSSGCYDMSNSVCSPCSVGQYTSSAGATVCSACSAGKVATAPGSTYCTNQCTMGYYQDPLNASVCLLCKVGQYTVSAGATECLTCQAGSYYSSAGDGIWQCQACGTNSYSGATNSSTCTTCPAGQYTLTSGATACLMCGPGTYYNSVSPTMPCYGCSSGYYSSGYGAVLCAPCQSGEYSAYPYTTCTACGIGKYRYPAGGANTPCNNCYPGTYASSQGQSVCYTCPTNTYFTGSGASSCNNCTLTDTVATYKSGCGNASAGVVLTCSNTNN